MQISRLATAHIKIHQIPHVIFGTKSQFFFKLCITLQFHKTQLFCTFSSKTLYTLDKRSPSKCIFWLSVARMKLNQITSFFNPRVSSPRVSSPFSVMTNNSYKCSSWNIICFGQKERIKVQFFRLLSALMKVHPLPHAIFETTRSGCIQILHHCLVSWKITSLYFLAQTSYTLDKIFGLLVIGWKFTKFPMSYRKPQASFSLNFVSSFNVMGDKSSVLF